MACYALSDIHGRLKTLDRLLEKVSPAEDDEIYILGDMVDRGPDSVEVMKLCRNLPNATVLLGNHEQLMLDFSSSATAGINNEEDNSGSDSGNGYVSNDLFGDNL